MNGSTLAHRIINRVGEEIEEKRIDPRIAAIIVNNISTAIVNQRNQEKRCKSRLNEREFYDDVFDKASLFSTIPASIEPNMITTLIENVLKAYKLQRGI